MLPMTDSEVSSAQVDQEWDKMDQEWDKMDQEWDKVDQEWAQEWEMEMEMDQMELSGQANVVTVMMTIGTVDPTLQCGSYCCSFWCQWLVWASAAA